MEESNITALLAFYNLLAAKIGLEDCKTLKDVRNLMPILANYMKVGVPNFVVDSNFGFRNAIALIVQELDEEFHSQLNAEAAENGDVFEAIKIHMAMIYTFRLLQTEAFSTICEQLEGTHQRRLARVIECLDDRHRWSLVPWPKLLNTVDQQLRTEDSDENKENSVLVERLQRKSFNFTSTPKPSPARKPLFFPCGNSPIHKVVSSPRGHEVVRINALEREVKSLREIRDVFGRERDKAEELCQQKEQENSELLKKIEKLQARIEHILPVAERVPRLEDQLLSLEGRNASLTQNLHEAEKRAAGATALVGNLKFELRKMDIKHEQLEKQIADHVSAVQRARDDSEMVEQLRKELLETKQQNATQGATIRELRNALDSQERGFASRLNDKDQEKAKYWEMMDQCKERSEENMLKSSDAVKKVQEEKRTLERELADSKRTLNELFEVAEKQKEVIAKQDRDQLGHEQTQADLEAIRKQLTERERLWNSEMERMRREFVEKEKSAKNAIERERNEARQLMDELRKTNTRLSRKHSMEITGLQQKIQAQEHSLHVAQNELREKANQLEMYTQQFEEELTMRTARLDRTPSMSVKFLPRNTPTPSSRASVVARPTPMPSTRASVFSLDSAGLNDDERLRELRERNRLYPPHMRSNYLPESAHLKNSAPDLSIMEELLRHRRFRENFLNLEDNSELKKRFLRLLMRENDKPEDGELL
ncbi:hypothetical protein GPALN_002047 [Globodera pallida]|nr:hypothetical protein GPALN_002047 [Globodera pallida]